MTNTATAANTGQAEKEKVEKRRALGRGLASLFGGPRVVTAHPATPGSGTGDGSRADVPAPQVPTSNVQQIPSSVQKNEVIDERVEETMQAVAVEGIPQSGLPAPHTAGPLQDSEGPIEIHAQAESRKTGTLVANLAIADIDKNPFQTRYVQDDEALEELADSIKANGVVQPIVVRAAEEEGRYVLILGERRLHASKKAGKTHIPAIVRKVSSQQAAEMTIIENLQREDLSPLEQAQAFRVLSTEFKLTQEQIGERVGLSRASIANYMRLLKLPREVMELLAEKRINFAQAKELLKLENNDRIAEAALYAVKKGMNVEQIEALVMRMEGLLDPLPDMPGQVKKTNGGARWKEVDPNVRAAQVELEHMLGVRVRIRDRKGKGKIVIEYATVDDYERVVGMLRGRA